MRNQYFYLLPVLLIPFISYAETIKCDGLLYNEYRTPVEVFIETNKNPVSTTPFTKAVVTYDYGFKQSSTYFVRRFEKQDRTIYKNISASSKFRFELENSAGNIKRASFGNIALSCKLNGKVTSQSTSCPFDNNGKSLANDQLLSSISKGTYDQVEDLIDECGASVDFTNSQGCSPLLLLTDSECGKPERNFYQYTPMNAEGALEFILSKKTKLEIIDSRDGMTALLKSVKYKNASFVDLLITAGANINTQDIDGNSPLMLAIKDLSLDKASVVLNAKPNLALKNNDGKTAYDLAKESEQQEIIDLLTQENKLITIKSLNGKCSPGMIHVMRGETITIELEANTKMVHFESDDLGVSLMAMPNAPERTVITPEAKGTFPYTCWEHGGPKFNGSIMIM